MKNLIIFSGLLLFSCNTKNQFEDTDIITQNTTDIEAITKMIKAQQECWNNGDIYGFMQVYWKSKDVIFTSLNHKATYGWQNILKRYQERHSTKSTMVELILKILDLNLISEKNAILQGNWNLIRENDHARGMFWLALRKLDDNWLITKYSTASFEVKKFTN